MPLETMKAKIEIAKALQQQSAEVWDFRVRHFATLSQEQRLSLKDASRTLNARADEVLEDALEEGTQRAEELLQKLAGHTQTLTDAKENIAQVGKVLDVAAKVAKAAAGVVSGGISKALPFL
jgi:hypothetical protein